MLAGMLAEASDWRQTTFPNIPLEQCQGPVRAAYAYGMPSLKYLDELPILCARLDEPGVAQRCLLQYDEVDENLHHPISCSLLGRSAESLRIHGEAIAPDGSGLSDRLYAEVGRNFVFM